MAEKFCGIYCICNLKNDKKYIGQSIDIHKRLHEHQLKLNNGIHENSLLQADYVLFGKKYFIFYIIEECSEENLSLFEYYHIKKMKTDVDEHGYNSGIPFSQREKIILMLRTKKIKNKEKVLADRIEMILKFIEPMINKKIFAKEIKILRAELLKIIPPMKDINYRRMGIRAINSIFMEFNLPYKISSGQSYEKNTRGKRYWIVTTFL